MKCGVCNHFAAYDGVARARSGALAMDEVENVCG
jgi:hypothetical protein